ncbi:hypothetical protein LMG29739_05081 [Paraburkholderia solisilvae]|uniref:Integrase catalytic domain-containing protein n=1 Tax=Paraburkholderia solisilvae TaxID=624376 RepID=A0A6J5EMS7_9BURK|nr:hypothetical protein LMG29739_05081 [Paraburkholderia solisilvae]
MMLHHHQRGSAFSYFEATSAYLERYGKPVTFHSDNASVFRSTAARKTGKCVTHFGRAMYELNIDTFCTSLSSAKGRVERAHLTLQDRLVKELRLRGMSTVAAANAYAPSFIAAYNALFAKPPRGDFDVHRPSAGARESRPVDGLASDVSSIEIATMQYDRVMYRCTCWMTRWSRSGKLGTTFPCPSSLRTGP